MGWEQTSGNSHIYNYRDGQYSSAVPPYFTWQRGNLWEQQEEAIKYINDTGGPIKISKVGIKTVACDSGNRNYWAFQGLQAPCIGWGALYTCYLRVSNDGGSTFETSSAATNDIPTTSGSNMNSPGTGPNNTAAFGNPPFTGDKGLIHREYEFENSPIIEPDGIAYLHMRISDFKGPSYQANIRFILNPSEMEIDLAPVRGPYIWRFCEDGRWHLKSPLYRFDGTSWVPVEAS